MDKTFMKRLAELEKMSKRGKVKVVLDVNGKEEEKIIEDYDLSTYFCKHLQGEITVKEFCGSDLANLFNAILTPGIDRNIEDLEQ